MMNRTRKHPFEGRRAPLGCLLVAVSPVALAGCAAGGASAARISALEKEVARLRQAATSGPVAQTAPAPTRQVAAAEAWRSVRGGSTLTLDGRVLFHPGQAKLRDSGKKLLGGVASDIRARYPEREIYVLGHTDDDPIRKTTWLDNRELSVARAVAVVRVLESHGIGPDRLVACGCGEHRPLAPNDTEEGKARNRRIEIVAARPLLEPVTP